ncbi:MAG: repeat protein [Acidobacteriaceae bacterium]|nr:repeat protein [Acidobacteriaceae bacterium]
MRWAVFIFLAVMLSVPGLYADRPQAVPVVPCASGDGNKLGCDPSKKDLKEAKRAFSKALSLQKSKHTDEAFDEFQNAARLNPKNIGYLTARELARQELVSNHIKQGNDDLDKGKQIEALAEFRNALSLDPQNNFAQQRLHDAIGEWAPQVKEPPRVVASVDEIQVIPTPGSHDFHYRGDSRGLLTQIATSFGLTADIDDSVVSRRVRFDIENVDFYTAMRAASEVTRTFWTSLDEKQILVASDSPENHRQFDQMGLRTFSVPSATTPTEVTDIVNLLRNLFEIRFVTPDVRNGTIVVRAPQNVLEAATQFMQGLDAWRPQVMLEVQVFEINHTYARDVGIQIPNQFQLATIPASVITQLQTLLASGQLNATTLAAALAQLSSQYPIFANPVATFGGGKTTEALSLGTLKASLALNQSSVSSLDHVTLRVAQGNDATFHLGSRYPVLTSSYSATLNTGALSQLLGSQAASSVNGLLGGLGAIPSFSYEDLGLSLKAKPLVNGNSDVALQFELQFRSLSGQSVNGAPIISNREYKGNITLTAGEPAVVVGNLSRTDMRTLTGIPGLASIPGLNQLTSEVTNEQDDDELLVTITPHVISNTAHEQSSEIWMGGK